MGGITDIFSKNEIVIEQCKKKFIDKEIQTCRCMFDLDMDIVYEFEDWDIAPRKHIRKGFVCKKNKKLDIVYEFEDWDIAPRKHIRKGFVCKKNKKFDFDACDNMSSSPFGIKLI